MSYKFIVQVPSDDVLDMGIEIALERFRDLVDIGSTPSAGVRFPIDLGIDKGMGWWKVQQT